MRYFWLFCALGALCGCRTVAEPSGEAIALFCSTYEGVKTEALKAGEQIAVFACAEGTEDYFLEAAKFLVDADGKSLTYGSAVYYPDPKQAVRFLAYFPYHTGTFSVPTDQSTAKALKQADLCGAVASTTPVVTPVALEFRHLMARVVVITTNKPTTKITFPNAVASGVLHAATAELVLEAERKDISTTGNELIVPVQPLSRLVLTASGIEYVFDTAPITLEAGKTTTLDLTLHPSTKTATLSGSSVTDWGSVKGEGNPSPAVSNTLLLHWPSYVPQGAAPDQVIFTIGGADYPVSNGITYANHTFTVSFASSVLRYPYTISKIAFYRGATSAFPTCADLLGAMIYKSGASTIGIKDQIVSSVLIDDLWWATGNLVASNAVAGAHGQGGCRIGEPADGGLYFQFGSLIGWKGGNQANSGTGVGMPQAPLTSASNGNYWNGVKYDWNDDAMVWPTAMTAPFPTSWPQGATTNQWYFGLQTDWSTAHQNIRDFLGLATGALADKGIGDPCTYYLGGMWRLPTTTEQQTLCNNQGGQVQWDDINASWVTSPVNGGNFADEQLFFPASGYRFYLNGSFYSVTVDHRCWSNAIGGPISGFYFGFYSGWVVSQGGNNRSGAFSVRCVSN